MHVRLESEVCAGVRVVRAAGAKSAVASGLFHPVARTCVRCSAKWPPMRPGVPVPTDRRTDRKNVSPILRYARTAVFSYEIRLRRSVRARFGVTPDRRVPTERDRGI